MKLRVSLLALSLGLLVLGGLLTTSGNALAHERRAVGNFSFVVGFLNEPALLNQPNSIDLRISHTADSSPVTGAEKTLKAEILNGSQSLKIDLTPRFNTPGAYNASFTPTASGSYSFHFTGALEGTNIDEKFTSSSSTFSNVAEPVAFPAPLPSNQNLEERLIGIQASADSKSASSDKSGTAMILAIVGIVVGATGLGVGGIALTRKAS